MAQRSGAGEAPQPLDHTDDHGLFCPSSAAEPIIHFDGYSEYDSDETPSYLPRLQDWAAGQRHFRSAPDLRCTPSPEPEHRFFIIREGSPPLPAPMPTASREVGLPHNRNHSHHHHLSQPTFYKSTASSPPPVACFMERTDSGRTIMTETDLQPALECPHFRPQDDRNAALKVKQHMARPRPHVKRHERILRALIHPRAHADKATEFEIDNAALESIFSAADEIFFQGRLSCRVHWEWSSGCVNGPAGGGGQLHQGSRIIGTTALRRANPPERGGYETLIVLSSPILKDTSYNRRLLISTFLHELIHSYLFICCGFQARHCGGHTRGFKEIAAMIDEWAGSGTLRLRDMEADLEHFREDPQRVGAADEDYHNMPPHRAHLGHHHQGGVDFYDLNDSPWSTGPRVVFGGHTTQAADLGWDRCDDALLFRAANTGPMSSASTWAEDGRWRGYGCVDDPWQMQAVHLPTLRNR